MLTALLEIGGILVELYPTPPLTPPPIFGVAGAPVPAYGVPSGPKILMGVFGAAVLVFDDANAPAEILCVLGGLVPIPGVAGANVVFGAMGVTIPRVIEALVA